MIFRPRLVVLSLGYALAMACCLSAAEDGGVYNGSFEKTAAGGRRPDGWQAEGDRQRGAGADRREGPDARPRRAAPLHAVRARHVRQPRHDRTGRARGRPRRPLVPAEPFGAGRPTWKPAWCRSAWSEFRVWAAAGLYGQFPAHGGLAAFRVRLPGRARRESRRQPPGDLFPQHRHALAQTTWRSRRPRSPSGNGCRRFPSQGVTNALPNSSFEGGEGWGCSAGSGDDWTANLFRRIGEWDDSEAFHGKRSWKVTLSPSQPLMLYGGYTELASEVRSVELGHAGWVRVEPGQPYVFSVYVKSDRADVPVRVSLERAGRVGPGQAAARRPSAAQWQRIEVSHTPKGEFLRGCLGFELPEGESRPRTLWIDAAQFERGTSASPYHPRAELEAGIETGVARQPLHRSGQGPPLPPAGLQRRQTGQAAPRPAPRHGLLGPHRLGGEAGAGGRPGPVGRAALRGAGRAAGLLPHPLGARGRPAAKPPLQR